MLAIAPAAAGPRPFAHSTSTGNTRERTEPTHGAPPLEADSIACYVLPMLRLAWLATPALLLHAGTAAADPPERHALRGMPATYELWREERDLVRARVRDAELAEEAAERSGDEAAEERAERELEAAKDAFVEFRDRTTSRDGPMLAGGIALVVGGTASLALGGMFLFRGPQLEENGQHGGIPLSTLAAWIAPTAGALAFGSTFIAVGARKRWRGPDAVAPRVGIAPGAVSISGRF
jgi:hypothetical protein